MADADSLFDFKRHEQAAVSAYFQQRGFYGDLASVVKRILEECFKRRELKIHSIEARAKDAASFGRKASEPAESDPSKPKYPFPLNQITDLAGVRVIAFFPSTLSLIEEVINEEFRVVERSDKGAELIEEDKFGYQSIHYLVKLSTSRSSLPEYEPFANAVAEIQVRTILQHAWAEIEHDIQYKSASVIPTEIRRRFMSVAGMLEIADREFQAIQDADRRLTEQARSNVQEGQLKAVEITPDALRAYLDKTLGPDGRMRDFSYGWTVRLLKRLGFRTLEQVEKCITDFDDDRLSRVATGTRQGQLSRFELLLIAGMGEIYFRRHFWANESWWTVQRRWLDKIRDYGIDIRGYDPLVDSSSTEAVRAPEMPAPVSVGVEK